MGVALIRSMRTKQWIKDGNGFERSWNISSPERSICNIDDESDAYLIATAPELLEQLKKVYGLLEMRNAMSIFNLKDQIEQVIAKAEGQAK